MTLHFFEFRIDYGPGFRVYFSIQGQKILLLLVGGDKRTQSKDIENAKSKSSSKPAVKYDDWMMERLKKIRKRLLNISKLLRKKMPIFLLLSYFHFAGFRQRLICPWKTSPKKQEFLRRPFTKPWVKKEILLLILWRPS